MTTSGGSEWCTRCHHLVWRADDGLYLHVSDDDWSEGDCGCASNLTRCVPESAYARWVGSVQAMASAVLRLTGTVTAATGAYAGLAAELKQEDP